MKKWSALFFLIMLFAACSKSYKGDVLPNQAPETSMSADTILRFEDNRFKSVVEVEWSGDDPDGFIKGFEVSLDGNSWTFTTKQDSSFTLVLPNNSDTADFIFYVRSVDNEGLVDPTPASLSYPVKNSAPEVQFIIGARNPSRSFPAVKYFWNASDPDGDASIDYFELVWNDTNQTLFKLSSSFSEATFKANQLSGSQSYCSVYPGLLTTALKDSIGGMLLDAENVLYLRAVDKVGAKSDWATTPGVFIRKPSSDILFINGQQSTFNRASIQQFYTSKIAAAINKSFDTLQAGPNGAAATDLSVDPQTQDRVFSFFTKIFVYSENSEYILSLMQRSSTGFFSQGGRIMLITEGNDVIEDQPSYLDFSPISKYTSRPSKVSLLFNLNDSLYSGLANYPALVNKGSILSGIRPFETPGNNSNFSYQNLYQGVITQDSSGNIGIWNGNSTLVAKRTRLSTNKTDFIICMVPIYRFEDGPAMNQWFVKMLNDELQF